MTRFPCSLRYGHWSSAAITSASSHSSLGERRSMQRIRCVSQTRGFDSVDIVLKPRLLISCIGKIRIPYSSKAIRRDGKTNSRRRWDDDRRSVGHTRVSCRSQLVQRRFCPGFRCIPKHSSTLSRRQALSNSAWVLDAEWPGRGGLQLIHR